MYTNTEDYTGNREHIHNDLLLLIFSRYIGLCWRAHIKYNKYLLTFKMAKLSLKYW